MAGNGFAARARARPRLCANAASRSVVPPTVGAPGRAPEGRDGVSPIRARDNQSDNARLTFDDVVVEVGQQRY